MARQLQFREFRARPARGSSVPVPLAVRLPNFVGGPADAAARLSALKIAIVGLGSVGQRIATHLARCGVLVLWLVDPKRLKPASLLTHEIGPNEVGKPKAWVTAHRCRAINPSKQVFVFDRPAEQLPMDAFAEADLVVMATDNLAVEIEVAQRCIRLGKSLVHASVHGNTLTAHVRAFANADGQSPCPVCGFGEGEWRMLNEQTHFSCEGFTPAQPTNHLIGPPTMGVSSLCSLAADLALNQILRITLQLGAPVVDTCLEFCGYTNHTVTSRLARNPNCPVDHRRYALAPAKKPLADTTMAELVGDSADRTAVTVDGYAWVESGVCQCPAQHVVRLFVAAGCDKAGRCANCRGPILAQPFFTHRTVAASLLNGALKQTLKKLGAPNTRCVLVCKADESVLFREADVNFITP